MELVTKAYVLDNGEIIEDSILQKYATKAHSKQLPPDIFMDSYSANNLMEPIYDLSTLAQLLEENTYHYRCCKTKARDTAGLGWQLVPRQGVKNPRVSQKKQVEEFLLNNGTTINAPSESLTETLNRMMVDYEATGNGYLEVIRDSVDGPIVGLAHMPSHTIRRHACGYKYLQIRGARQRWFKEIGTINDVHIDSGVESKPKSLELELRANEIIHFYNYSCRSDFYGVPDILPALRALLLDREAIEYNINFFENHAVPAYMITVSGGQLTEDTKNALREYFQNNVKKARHSSFILEAEGQTGLEPIKIDVKPLSVDVKDASFRLLRTDNRNEILSAHGVPSYRAGLSEAGSLGGNIASEATEIYKQSVIEPRQAMIENILNIYILWDTFKATDWEFKFNDIDSDDEIAKNKEIMELCKLGLLSPNEGRLKMGLEKVLDKAMDQHYIDGKSMTNIV